MDLNSFRLLIVDDEVYLLNSIGRFLKLWGCEYDMVTNVDKAISLLDAHREERNYYHLVLVDIHIPGKNGLSLVKYIKQNDINLPCIIMTGFADNTSRNNSYSAGCDNFINKPFTPLELKAVIEETIKSNDNSNKRGF